MKMNIVLGTVLTLSLLGFSACNNGQKAPAAPTTPSQVTAGEVVEKSTVDGCGESGDFLTPFKSGDFNAANSRASCAFNDSVKANPDKPDTKAAEIALLSRLALVWESPEMEYLLLQKVPANTLFGPAGNPSNLDPVLNNLTGGADKWQLVLNYFKKQADAGHLPNDVFGKAFELIDHNFPDWHVLAKAMSKDPSFVDIEIPGVYIGKPSETYKANYTDASAVDFYITVGRAASKILSHYDVGISSKDSLADLNALAADLNADPKFLSLKGNANASDAAPYLDSVFNAVIQAAANYHVSPGVLTGSSDAYPKQAEDALTASQFKESLQGGMVWLAESHYKTAIDLKKMLENLPDAKAINLPVVTVNGTSLDSNPDFQKQWVSGFTLTNE